MFTPYFKNPFYFSKLVLLSLIFILLSPSLVISQKWEGISAGTYRNIVTALAVDTTNNQLVIGGQDIKDVNGQSSCTVFKWSPENGVEILSPYNLDTMNIDIVNQILFRRDSMLVVGRGGVAIWKNNHWTSKFDIQSPWHQSIHPYGNNYLLSTGQRSYSTLGSLVEWDGDTTVTDFHNISAFISSYSFVETVIEYKGDLYVAGSSLYYDGVIMHDIIKWDGTQWTTLGSGLNHATQLGGINDMVVYKGELYIIGLFHVNGDTKENYVARWDGTQWKLVGGDFWSPNLGYGMVSSLHMHNGYLYVSGTFTKVGGVPATGIARWDGNEWCGCGSIIEIGATVTDLTHYRDTLYISGNFIKIDNDSILRIARFIGDDFADTCGSTVGIKTVQLEKQTLKGYPNPAQNELNFDFPNPINQLSQISVYNIVGQLFIHTQEFIYERKLTLDISTLPQGIYFGEIVTNQKNYVYSFVTE